ncbi:hypothetical protein Tco_1162274, partial [Tanacetum coccineum]
MTYSTSPRNTRWRHTGVSFVEDLDLKKDIDDMKLQMNEIMELIRERYQIHEPPISFDEPEGSNDDTKVIFDEEQFLKQQSTAHVTPPQLAYIPPLPCLATMEPLDAFLMGDEVISTTPARENDVYFLADEPVSIPRIFDEPLGNSDSMSRSFEISDLFLEELTAEIGLDDSISTKIDDGDYDSEGGSHLLTRGDGCPMTACYVAAALTCTRLQVAANDWYKVAGGSSADLLEDATCICIGGELPTWPNDWPEMTR